MTPKFLVNKIEPQKIFTPRPAISRSSSAKTLLVFFSSMSSIFSSSASPPFANTDHMIQSLCKQGHLKQALHALALEPNPSSRTYESLILACAAAHRTIPSAASYGRIVHRHLVEHGFHQDPFLSTRLVEMYSSFGALHDARMVFDAAQRRTVYLWNAFLRALAVAGEGDEAMEVYDQIARADGIEGDSFTYSYALKACVGSDFVASRPYAAFERVRRIHAHAMRRGYDSMVHVATTLVDVYAKLGWVFHARKVFDGMLAKNVVSWSAIIACYAKNEMPFEALELFRRMMTGLGTDSESVPNSVTMVSVLHACAGLSAMQLGMVVHAYVLRRGLDSILPVVNALVTMYVKCGSLVMGRRVFEGMGCRRDVVSWNSMVSGLGMHGHGKEALELFEEMIRTGISPSPISFVGLLGACSHAGLVEEGKQIFESMRKRHGVIPSVEHYACMVDLLGRAGRLDEAAKVIEGMRMEPGPTTWGALLGACRTHGKVELAERACKRLFKLEPTNAGNYVLLADIYSAAGMTDKVSEVKALIEAHGLEKMRGRSWIEVKRRPCLFVSVEDATNPQIEEVHALVARLVTEMKAATGYVPQTKVVLYDVEEAEKERILLGHSEKLAVAYGLINTSAGEVIRISKNLRLCEDCHAVTKFISKFADREIIVRDVNRLHRFRDGVCSCGEYW